MEARPSKEKTDPFWQDRIFTLLDSIRPLSGEKGTEEGIFCFVTKRIKGLKDCKSMVAKVVRALRRKMKEKIEFSFGS
jgi:hypothetical protein